MSFIVYAPFETMVNGSSFSDYHRFGSESRMLAGFEEIPGAKIPAPAANPKPANPQ